MKNYMQKRYISIAGGLGNQLFMFYAGLYIQEVLKLNVVFDLGSLSSKRKLHKGLNIKELGLTENVEVVENYFFNTIHKKVLKLPMLNKKTLNIDQIGYVKMDELKIEKSTRIEGYFQTWKYFDAVKSKPILKRENIPQLTKWFNEYEKIFKSENCVAVHVRRGDYLLQKNRRNGLLSPNYYKTILSNFHSGTRVMIFSDSPEIVNKEFSSTGLNAEVLLPPYNSDPAESLLLMSYAKNIVISNSTFSWWAGMLAEPKTRVIAPAKWFNEGEDPKNIYPDTWLQNESNWIST